MATVALPVGLVLGRLRQANDWSLLELYAAMAVAFIIFFTPAMLWIDSAPDGPMRHRKRR